MIWTDDLLADLKHRWFAEGQSQGLIAEAFGVTRSTIAGKLHRMGWSRTTPVKVIPYPERKRLAKPVRRRLRPLMPRADAIPHEGLVELSALRRGDCRWPIGEQVRFLFCGAPADGSPPYCKFHARQAYVPSKVRA